MSSLIRPEAPNLSIASEPVSQGPFSEKRVRLHAKHCKPTYISKSKATPDRMRELFHDLDTHSKPIEIHSSTHSLQIYPVYQVEDLANAQNQPLSIGTFLDRDNLLDLLDFMKNSSKDSPVFVVENPFKEIIAIARIQPHSRLKIADTINSTLHHTPRWSTHTEWFEFIYSGAENISFCTPEQEEWIVVSELADRLKQGLSKTLKLKTPSGHWVLQAFSSSEEAQSTNWMVGLDQFLNTCRLERDAVECPRFALFHEGNVIGYGFWVAEENSPDSKMQFTGESELEQGAGGEPSAEIEAADIEAKEEGEVEGGKIEALTLEQFPTDFDAIINLVENSPESVQVEYEPGQIASVKTSEKDRSKKMIGEGVLKNGKVWRKLKEHGAIIVFKEEKALIFGQV